MWYNAAAQRVGLSSEWEENFIAIGGEDFFLEELSIGSNRGGNSSVFRATDLEGERPCIVKLCRYPLNSRERSERQRIDRFFREIRALRDAQASEYANCVIPILGEGIATLPSRQGDVRLKFFLMREADSDLRTFLEENDLGIGQKVELCNKLLGILIGLHDIGLYHRDIKPENIFILDGSPVFGDLGLANRRPRDQDIDTFWERVGPLGYLSPEATNKKLALRNKPNFAFDCWIDDKSDVFQLGQIFWLILQDEVPTGHLDVGDVRFPPTHLLDTVIRPMLQYGKARRPTAGNIAGTLAPFMKEYALT